jgi:hypothetical protein
VADGKITAIDTERVAHLKGQDTARLAVAYEFSVDTDGPFTGESFWTPAFFSFHRAAKARRKLHIHQQVRVRYRPDDHSVNTLDGGVARLLRMSERRS